MLPTQLKNVTALAAVPLKATHPLSLVDLVQFSPGNPFHGRSSSCPAPPARTDLTYCTRAGRTWTEVMQGAQAGHSVLFARAQEPK